MIEVLTAILAIIIVLAGACGIVFSIAWLIDYCNYRDGIENKPKIKFSAFRTFYDINPSRWYLGEATVECKIPRKDINNDHLYSGLFDTRETFVFTYIDYLRYSHWRNSKYKFETELSNDKVTARMLEAVKQDVADFESKTMRETREALEIIRSITNAKS